MDQQIVKRLVWSGILAAYGALASFAATRVAAATYRRFYGEEPPE